jgi:chlorobactene glucosyltransferase
VVSSEVLEDVRLARAFKQRAHHCGLFFAPGAFVLRPYQNLREILAGYSKNLYEGMGRRLTVGLGAVIFVFVGTLAPYLLLAVLAATRLLWGWQVASLFWWAWLTAICVLIHLFRWRLERMQGRSGAYCWSHPLGNLVLVWVIVRSIFSVEATWKGREFVDGRAASPKEKRRPWEGTA